MRKGFQSVSFAGSAVCLLLLSGTTSQWLALLYITPGLGAVAVSAAGFLVNHLDIGPRYAGVPMGIANTVGTVPGILAPLVTGFIIQATGSWDIVFTWELASQVSASSSGCSLPAVSRFLSDTYSIPIALRPTSTQSMS